jgi:DNA-binding beta-propeller fold protein YncE
VHAPLLPEAPTRSSTVVTTDTDVVVVSPDAGTVTAVAKDTLAVRWEVPVGERPRTVAAMPDGTLWVAVQGEDRIAVVRGGVVEATIPLGHGAAPFGIAPAGARALVTLEGDGALVAIDVASRAIEARIELGVPVRGVAVTGTRAYVTRFRSPAEHGEVFEVDLGAMALARTISLALDPGPDEANTGRGVPNYLTSIAISPDGLRAVIPSNKDNVERGRARDGEPLDDDNTVRTIVSAIDLGLGAEVLGERIDLDDHDMASAAAYSVLGDLVFIATQGTNRVDVYETASRRLVSGFATSLAPQGLWLEGDRLYVQSFTERALDVVDVSTLLAGVDAGTRTLTSVRTVAVEPLSPEALLGEQIFYNADDTRMSADGYLACATCHLDGDSDGRVWDFTDRGEGFRNTTDLRGRAGTAHGPVHWSANFDEIQDFEGDIRLRFGGSGLMRDADWETTSDPLGEAKTGLSPALDALATYVATFDTFPRSPWRNDDGTPTEAAVRGREIFESLDCLTCHGGERLTDSGIGGLHDVGTLRPTSGSRLAEPLTGIDTPTLRGVWAGAPYFHDGSAATLEDTLAVPGHGNAQDLDAAELADLVAFLRELENEELGYPEPTATTPGCGCAAGRRHVPWGLALALLGVLLRLFVRRPRSAGGSRRAGSRTLPPRAR